MARTRSIPDHHIAAFACELLVARGASAVTFAEVSQLCGLAPPTLVQRFGSRAGLLAAAAVALRARLTSVFAQSDTGSGQLAALDHAFALAAPLQHGASLLARETDMAAFAVELRKQISYRLAMAVEASELPRCDVAELARTLQIVFAGAVVIAHLESADPGILAVSAVRTQLAAYV